MCDDEVGDGLKCLGEDVAGWKGSETARLPAIQVNKARRKYTPAVDPMR